MRPRRKGQVSVEFIAVMTLMFFIFVLFTAVIVGRIAEFRGQRSWNTLVDLGDIFESEIKGAAAMETGYRRSFWLPPLIEAKNYSIIIYTGDGVASNKTIFQVQYVNFSKDEPYSVVIPLRTKGTVNKGLNRIQKNVSWVCLNTVSCP
ncbi:MAG: hypothetical protein ABIC95_05325 [archaeon]